MPNRSTRFFALAAASTAALVLVACGGGGGGGGTTPVPTPVPTVTPTNPPGVSAACAAPAVPNPTNCAVSFASTPSGIAVFIDGVQAGTTPFTSSPTFRSTPHTVTFGTGSNPYTVTLDQTANGSKTIYYNSVVDTGSTSVTGNQSSTRQSQSFAGELRRGMRSVSQAPPVVTTGVYVRYDSAKLTSRTIAKIEADAGAESATDVLSSVAAIRGRVVRIPAGGDLAALTARLTQEAAVAGVYPLHQRVPLAAPQQTTNDPYFAGTGTSRAISCGMTCQWDLRQIRADYAWFYTKGQNAKIAVLDTGLDLGSADFPSSHIAFSATTVGGSVRTSTGAGQNNPSYPAAQDTNGHGTNVSGIAAASSGDGVGFASVSYGAALYIYRIFPPATASSDQQSASTADEAAALTDAVSRGVDVINLSLGAPQFDPSTGTGYDQAEHDAIAAALAAGVVVVAAAGNESAGTLDFPGAYDGVISVGASSLADGVPNGSGKSGGSPGSPIEYVASYSNSGPGLSVVAPGGDPGGTGDNDINHWIFNNSTNTAAFQADQCLPATLPDVCKALFAGTSQATPHVAGAVALVQSALRLNGKSTLTAAQMKTLIEGTADNLNDPRQGHGRLNVVRAIDSALGVSPTFLPTISTPAQFVAFAYTNSGQVNVKPAIANVFYTNGVPVGTNGTFRIADILPSTGTYRIGVWFDANGNGKVDAGDQFGASTLTCSGQAPQCKPGTITVTVVPSGNFTLP